MLPLRQMQNMNPMLLKRMGMMNNNQSGVNTQTMAPGVAPAAANPGPQPSGMTPNGVGLNPIGSVANPPKPAVGTPPPRPPEPSPASPGQHSVNYGGEAVSAARMWNNPTARSNQPVMPNGNDAFQSMPAPAAPRPAMAAPAAPPRPAASPDMMPNGMNAFQPFQPPEYDSNSTADPYAKYPVGPRFQPSAPKFTPNRRPAPPTPASSGLQPYTPNPLNNATSLPSQIAPSMDRSAMGRAQLGMSALVRTGPIPGTPPPFAQMPYRNIPKPREPRNDVQMYGGIPGASTTGATPGARSTMPNMTSGSYDPNGRPNRLPDSQFGQAIPGIPLWKQSFNGKPLGEPPKQRYGPNDANPGLGGATSNEFRERQQMLSDSWKNGEAPDPLMRVAATDTENSLLDSQTRSRNSTFDKYKSAGATNPEEAARLMWRERSLRQSMTRRGIGAPGQRAIADNAFGRSTQLTSFDSGNEAFPGANRQYAGSMMAGSQRDKMQQTLFNKIRQAQANGGGNPLATAVGPTSTETAAAQQAAGVPRVDREGRGGSAVTVTPKPAASKPSVSPMDAMPAHGDQNPANPGEVWDAARQKWVLGNELSLQ